MTKALATVFAGIACLLALPAHALNTRTWISSAGADSAGCGPIANPCRTLQYAHDNTSAGGEIDVKDSAGYGSVIITKAINIVGDGSIAGVLAGAGANAITINAGSTDKVILRGLTIEGAGIGLNGIYFSSGGTLDIANCVIQNFASGSSSAGIFLQPTSGTSTFSITNINVSHNRYTGLLYSPPLNASAAGSLVIDHVTAIDNGSYGFNLYGANTSSATVITLSDSLASKNGLAGFILSGSLLKADIDLCHADQNGGQGFYISGATATIGRSTAAHNTQFGLYNVSGTVSSYGNNGFGGNGSGPTLGTIGTANLH